MFNTVLEGRRRPAVTLETEARRYRPWIRRFALSQDKDRWFPPLWYQKSLPTKTRF